MKSLLIIGAGGYGQLVKELAQDCGYEKIDFLDDKSELAIGRVNDFELFQGQYEDAIIAIGNPKVRREIAAKIENSFRMVTLIHPKAFVSKSAVVQKGCIIEAGAIVNANTTIEPFNIINANAVVNHDAMVNTLCQVDCNAVVAAGAWVPEGTKVESCTVWKEKR